MCILETFIDVIKFYSKFENNTRCFSPWQRYLQCLFSVYIRWPSFSSILFVLKCYDAILKLSMWKKGLLLKHKPSWEFSFNVLQESGGLSYRNIYGRIFFTILFLYKICNKATLRRKYWCLHRLLFSGWYIVIMPFLYNKPFCFCFW